MPSAFFQVRLSVQSTGGGDAELLLPSAIGDLHHQFVLVKDGGEEGIVRLDGPDATLKQVEKDKDCKKLTPRQLEALRASYPKPRMKEKYRAQLRSSASGATEPMAGLFEVDEAGHKIVDTFQTVRAGFYLIDVPIEAQPTTA